MRPRIIAVGEVLWDLLPSGAVLGGAPANFAFHTRAFGAEVSLISRIGNDDLGRNIQGRCEAAGLAVDTLQVDPVLPTGTVSVELSADGQPCYTIHEHTAWDALAADEAALAAVAKADAVCFGSLAQRSSVSRESIGVLLEAAAPAAMRIFDINLRQSFYSREILEKSLRVANVLKLNDAELPVIAEMFGLKGDDHTRLATLVERWELRAVALTRGSRGALLLAPDGFSEHPGTAPPSVRDTIGAGDAFTAVLALGLLAQWPLDVINDRANAIAAYVCSQSGATPELPPSFSSFFK